jgi:hypothetical protein
MMGMMTESSLPSGHARHEVGSGDGAECFWLEADLCAGDAALAGAVVEDRAAVERRGE